MTHNAKHGQSNSPEYVSWRHMKQRCTNPKRPDYIYYGAKGIAVCERWQDFDNFLADMGFRPGIDHTLDRIDFKGNYELSNCRWATKAEQNRNKSNVYTAEQDQTIKEAAGRGLNFKQIAQLVGKSHSGVTMRAYRIGICSGQPRKIMP